MIDLEDLKTFLAIVDGGTLRAAARTRGVTPSLVSRRLAGLEERLGVTLIARSTRSSALTDAGRRLEGHAREVLGRLERAVDDMQGRAAEPKGHLRIAANHGYGSLRVAPVLASFLEAHPRVTAELVLDDIRAELIGHGFDAALRIGALPDSELRARAIDAYRVAVYAAPRYLERAGVPAHPDAIADHAGLELAAAAAHPWKLVGSTGTHVVRPVRRAVCSSGHALLEMAKAGLGLIAQPDFLVEAALAEGSLVRVLEGYAAPERVVHLVYPDTPFMPAHLRAFVDAMRGRAAAPR